VVRAVRACGAVVRAGWLARQAIALVGRGAGRDWQTGGSSLLAMQFSECWMPIRLSRLDFFRSTEERHQANRYISKEIIIR
jgi:hypothetical protein